MAVINNSQTTLTMRHIILTILTICMLPAVSIAGKPEANGKPDIEFTQTSADFGSIHEDGHPVKASFEFTNTGTAPLLIISASASCGCTKPTFDPEPVKPGQKSVISVTFNPKGKRGEFDKTVTVRTNIKDKRRVVLHLSGVVIPPAK